MRRCLFLYATFIFSEIVNNNFTLSPKQSIMIVPGTYGLLVDILSGDFGSVITNFEVIWLG